MCADKPDFLGVHISVDVTPEAEDLDDETTLHGIRIDTECGEKKSDFMPTEMQKKSPAPSGEDAPPSESER